MAYDLKTSKEKETDIRHSNDNQIMKAQLKSRISKIGIT